MRYLLIIVLLVLIAGIAYIYLGTTPGEKTITFNIDRTCSYSSIFEEQITFNLPLNKENIANAVKIKGYKISEIQKPEENKWNVVLVCEQETEYACGALIELYEDSRTYCFSVAI